MIGEDFKLLNFYQNSSLKYAMLFESNKDMRSEVIESPANYTPVGILFAKR